LRYSSGLLSTGDSFNSLSRHKRMARSTPTQLPALLLIGLALLVAAILAEWRAWGEHVNERVPAFVGLALLAGALYLTAVYVVHRFPLGRLELLLVLAAAIAFRLELLPASPALSEDIYRYQWEGRVVRSHLSPYTVFPDHPAVRHLQDPHHPLTTGRTTPTIYPPLSQAAFASVETLAGYKRLFTALDLASLGVILLLLKLRDQPPHRVLIYAWNPTVLTAFAMCGHHDSLAVFTLLGALSFSIAGRPLLASGCLGLSFLLKLFPVILLPHITQWGRRRWVNLLPFAGVVLLGYAPFLSARRGLWQGLSHYLKGWEGNDSFFRLIRHVSASKAQAEFVASVLLVGLVVYTLRSRWDILHASLAALAGLLLLSPNAFPWYFSWSVPFLCFVPSPAWLLMTVTCVLGYAPVVAYAAGQSYRDSPLILTLEYAPVAALLAVEAWRRRGVFTPP
jgi:alpha-1,6-mannosyltransferase